MAYGTAPVFILTCFICLSASGVNSSVSEAYSSSECFCPSASLSASQTYIVSSETVPSTVGQSFSQSSSQTYIVSSETVPSTVGQSFSQSSIQTHSVSSETVPLTVGQSFSQSSSQTYSVSLETVSSTQNQGSTQSSSHTYSASECLCPSAFLSSSQTYSVSPGTISPTLYQSSSETLSQTYSVSPGTISPTLYQSTSETLSQTYSTPPGTISPTLDQSSSETLSQTYSVSPGTISPTLYYSLSETLSQTHSVSLETISSNLGQSLPQTSSHTYTIFSETLSPTISQSYPQISSQIYSVTPQTVSTTLIQSSSVYTPPTAVYNNRTCNFCFLDAGSGDDVAECNKQQSSQACSSNVFPNLGTTHCYTAAGLYNNGSQVNSTGIARGCINCTDKESACADFAAAFNAQTNWTLLQCNIECCVGNDCNTQNVTFNSTETPPLTTNPSPTTSETPTTQRTTPRPAANLSCNFCFLDAGSGDDVAECNKQQSSQACSSNVFPNLGTTHCYTAAGLYNNGSQVNSTGIARGCINCTDKESACADFAAAFNVQTNWTLLQCNIECCVGNDCNTQNVTINATETPPLTTNPLPRTSEIPTTQPLTTNPLPRTSEIPTTQPTPFENTCYPFGPQQNDHKFGVNDVLYFYYGQCLEIKTNSIGFPFFGNRHYKLYICLNGKMQLNYAWSWWWPQKFGVYRWFKNMAIIAPFWARTDRHAAFSANHSEVFYHIYDQSGDSVLEKASQDVRLYDKSGAFAKFRATWVLVVTWVKLCPFVYYPYYYYYDYYNKNNIPLDCERSNTFQAVIITDGLNTFLMYCYPRGGIQWVVSVKEAYWEYWTQSYGLPVAGWNAGDNGQNYKNMKGSSNLRGMYDLDKKPGNTGEIGKYFWRIDNNNGKNALDKCLKWSIFQESVSFITHYNQKVKQDELMACPCNLWQAFFDRRFRWDWISTWPKLCFKSIRSKTFVIKDGTYLSPINGNITFTMRQLCCYSTQWPGAWGSLKTGPPDGSRVEVKVSYNESNRVEEILSDQQAYKACCVDTLECILFYKYRPSDNCSLYIPPIIRWGRGDPHFTTLDGRNYTFNGCGEYVMIDAQNATFQLQARTGLAQGNSTTATIFTAGAAKEETTSIVEVRVKEEGGMSILIDNTTYSGFNDLTNQSIEIGRNLFISKPEENCLEVSFPSSTSVKFCEKKGMLYFVVTPGDDYKNKTKGLMGTWNDNPNDDYTLPDGTVLPPSLTLMEIHFRFGDKWHINQSQSLFTYAQNESVDTFYKPDFIPMFADNITWANDSVRQAAKAQCGNDYECLFDVASTNDLSIGMVTKDIGIQLVNESNALENFPPKIVNPPDEINAKLNETVQLTITAEDDGMITFQVINEPAGARVNQSGNVLYFTWQVTSSQKVALSFVATDDKGASTAWNPTIKFCACKQGGQCVEPDEGDPINSDSKFIYMGCACQGGYTGRFCDSDIDACEMNGQPCYDGVDCIDLPPPANTSGYTCGPCPSGYTGNGAQCSDIDECQSNQTNNCEQICINVPGSFLCDCRDGYKIDSDKHSCNDINECEPTNDCMQKCNNTQGSYNCSCDQYFKTDPTNWRNCVALNPCDSNIGCINGVCFKGSNNEAKCACFANYELQNDGTTCKDINECDPARSLSLCTQICENTPGSHKCSCQKGFKLNKDGYSCEDVNECVDEDLYSCPDEFHKCVNTRGSYKCECEQNLYFIDGKCRGLDKNETAPIPELPTPRTPSEKEREQAVEMSLASKNFKWDFQTYKSFITETATVATDFCTENRTKCGLITVARRARRALFFDLYTPEQVNLLPGYPNNSTGTYLLAFYIEQPLGLFIGNVSVLPRETLLEIILKHKSALEKALGTNITGVELFLKLTTSATSATSPPTIEEKSNDSWKWIVIGVCVGVVVIIVVIMIVFCWMKKKEKVKPLPEDPLMMENYSKLSLERINPKDSNL